MQVNYSIPQDIDSPISEAAAERPGEAIRLRIHPQIWRVRPAGEQYVAWRKVSWTLECASVDDAANIRRGLNTFFAAASRLGPQQIADRLAEIMTEEPALTP